MAFLVPFIPEIAAGLEGATAVGEGAAVAGEAATAGETAAAGSTAAEEFAAGRSGSAGKGILSKLKSGAKNTANTTVGYEGAHLVDNAVNALTGTTDVGSDSLRQQTGAAGRLDNFNTGMNG